MAYITTDNLSVGMVVARKLIGRNGRILLNAGVALGDSHIQALRSLGVKGLEIRSVRPPHATVPHSSGPTPSSSETEGDIACSAPLSGPGSRSPVVEKPVSRVLHVTRAPSRPLTPVVEPQIARQTDIVVGEMLKGTAITKNSAIAAVVRLYTLRLLHSRKRQRSGTVAVTKRHPTVTG